MSKNMKALYIKGIYIDAVYITRNKTLNMGDKN